MIYLQDPNEWKIELLMFRTLVQVVSSEQVYWNNRIELTQV